MIGGLKEKAEQLIARRDWEGLNRMLRGLSNVDFRRMEKTMRVDVLTSLDNDLFWEAILHLIQFKRQAFIAGVTAAKHLAKNDTLSFTCQPVGELVEHLNGTDTTVKICNMMMPLLENERQVEEMFDALGVADEVTRIAVMLKVNSTLSYYEIFKQLTMMHDSRDIGRRCCLALMRRKDDRSYNMASILRCYFGIEELKSQLALQIEPFELSYLEKNYDNFVHFLEGKRPKID